MYLYAVNGTLYLVRRAADSFRRSDGRDCCCPAVNRRRRIRVAARANGGVGVGSTDRAATAVARRCWPSDDSMPPRGCRS